MSEKTLRDEFAMAALTGILSNIRLDPEAPSPKAIAIAAGTFADVMMAERPMVQAEEPAAAVPAIDPRPANCKFRLMDEGKPYPKSGCEACQINLVRECPHLPPSLHTFSHNRVTP